METQEELLVRKKNIIKNDNKLNNILKQLTPILDNIVEKKKECLIAKDFRNYDNKYALQVATKLNSILRKKGILLEKDANIIYTDYEYTHEKIGEIYELMSIINNDYDIPFIMDKQTICAYLRITIANYQLFLDNALYDLEIQNEFQSLENMLISLYQQSAENNIKNASAVKYRLGLKGKYGGNEIEEHQPIEQNVIIGNFSENEIKSRLAKDYNFLLLETKDKKDKK